MPNNLTAGKIQSRILHYAEIQYELKTAHHQKQKTLTALIVIRSGSEQKFKISIDKITDPNRLLPPILTDNFFEVKTYCLDRVFEVAPKIDVIVLDVKGSESFVFQGMQNILTANPEAAIYIAFNPTHFQTNGVNAKNFIYETLASGFSLVRIDGKGEPHAISENELLNSDSINLLLKRVIKQALEKPLNLLSTNPAIFSTKPSEEPTTDFLPGDDKNFKETEEPPQILNAPETQGVNHQPGAEVPSLDRDRYALALSLSGITNGRPTRTSVEKTQIEPQGDREPLKTEEQYLYQPGFADISFADGVAEMKKRGYKVVPTAIDNASPEAVANILAKFLILGINFRDIEINIDGYKNYFARAEYQTRYPNYYAGNQVEKSLEHYICLSILNLTENDIFVDLASESSPIPEIYHRLTGATTFSQDIMYQPGINGNQIGGDACAMPVPDGFASKAALTCSIEHFEGDADTRLFIELSRVLRPGGTIFVCPFYIYTEAATQTDPQVSLSSNVKFDSGTTLYCAQGWGNRHARFYSPESFKQRIMNPVKDKFKFEFYYLKNAAQVDPSVYARFAFTATRW